MTHRTASPGHRAATALGPLLLALLLAVPLGGSPPGRALGGTGQLGPPTIELSAAPATLLPLSGCPGASVPSQYDGTLVDVGGGGSAPPVANQSVAVNYSYVEYDYSAAGTYLGSLCFAAEASAPTSSNGSFRIAASIPSDRCVHAIGCWKYAGPYGPVSVGPGPGALPAGYFANVTGPPGDLRVARVLALASVRLAPAGLATVSLDAPTRIEAEALAADGTPSPATVRFAWTVQGAGWVALGPVNESNLTVKAIATGALATVEAWGNGSYRGAALSAPVATVLLTAVATQISQGGVGATQLDEGVPVTFSIVGSGALGYPYTATISPGLLEPPADVPCSIPSVASGVATLACQLSFAYNRTGSAQPFLTLSNGYSSATFAFAQVVVARALAVRVTPDPAIAYVGVPVPIDVSVPNGAGTAPYGPACLSNGTGGTWCESALGGPWTFAPIYGRPGTYPASVTLADAGGANVSSQLPITVVEHPSVGIVVLDTNALPVGASVTGYDVVLGGAYPASYWWNVTGPGSPGAGATVGAGTLLGAGTIPFALTTSVPGDFTLGLSIVDALGTRLAAATTFSVVSTNVTAVRLEGPSNLTGTAGSPVEVRYVAVDLLGDPVGSFRGPATVLAAGPSSGGLWLNASPSGPLPSAPGGFLVTASDWVGGALNLSVSAAFAGRVLLSLELAPNLTGPVQVGIALGPDLAHEELSALDRAASGDRAGSTLYEILDRFGDPVTPGYIVVRTVVGSASSIVYSPILLGASSSRVWVNYSASGSGPATVYVLSEDGEELLPPIALPGVGAPTMPAVLIDGLAGLALALGGTGAFALAKRRRHRGGPTGAGEASEEDVEDGLKRLADGRAHVLAKVPSERPVVLEEIAEGWQGRPPDAAELAEWVAALVAEGILVASVGPDGRPRFVRNPSPTPRSGPRIDVDPMALEAALERQRLEAELSGAEEDEGPDRPTG